MKAGSVSDGTRIWYAPSSSASKIEKVTTRNFSMAVLSPLTNRSRFELNLSPRYQPMSILNRVTAEPASVGTARMRSGGELDSCTEVGASSGDYRINFVCVGLASQRSRFKTRLHFPNGHFVKKIAKVRPPLSLTGRLLPWSPLPLR